MSGFGITLGRGFHVTFENGWTISVQFGAGNYCSNRHGEAKDNNGTTSTDAEIAAWPASGEMIEIEEDTVKGHCSPAEVLKWMIDIAGRP